MLPVIGVVGFKNSGKTFTISYICNKLSNEGYRILPIKHIAHEDFTIISNNKKDTTLLYHSCKGTGYVADSGELGIIIRDINVDIIDLSTKIRNIFNYDLIILEGFSRKIIHNSNIIKIICIKDKRELENLNIDGIYIPCSLTLQDKTILKIPEELDKLVYLVKTFIKIFKTYEKLPRIDCKKCGYTCWKMAEKIYRGEKSFNDCKTLQESVKIIVNEIEIPLNEFVRKLCTNIILGLIRSLKGVPENINNIRIEIRL